MPKIRTDIGSIKNFGLPDTRDKGGVVGEDGLERTIVFKLNVMDLPAVDQDTTGNGTADSYASTNPKVPSGARVKSAILRVTTTFAGGTSLTLGLAEQDGTAIDADGIDAAIAAADLAAGDVIACDGALVGAGSVLSTDGYLSASVVGSFTAGKADLVVVYEGENTR